MAKRKKKVLDYTVGEHHWEGLKPNPKKYFGFIYLITNTITERKYIGCKVYWHYRKKKPYKSSDWRTYTGSSKKLNGDILKFGKENFTFRIIKHTPNRGMHRYLETKEIVKRDAILKSKEEAYYNGQFSGCRYRPVDN